MHLSAAVLAPETLETGITRAITRALESGQPYITFPVDHAAMVSAAITEMDLGDRQFCCLADPTAFADHRGRVTICLQPPWDRDRPETFHYCAPRHLGARIHSEPAALARSVLVQQYLDTLEADGPTPASTNYLLELLR